MAEESVEIVIGPDGTVEMKVLLKEWLRLRERAFSDAAREFRLPAPKGMALIGIPGTGKSLTAKMIGDFDIRQLAADCDGFVGAELEQVIVDAMYEAFAEDRDITTNDITRAATKTVPLSKSQREVIEDLRAWLREGRAQSASFAGAAQAAEHQVPVLEV